MGTRIQAPNHFVGKASARFLTAWTHELTRTRFDITAGVRSRLLVELLLVYTFEAAVAALYFVPTEWLARNGREHHEDAHFVQVCEINTGYLAYFERKE